SSERSSAGCPISRAFFAREVGNFRTLRCSNVLSSRPAGAVQPHPSTLSSRMDIDYIYRTESARILATLIGLLGDFDLAEEAIQEAFAVALERWPTQGVPANPRAWLVSTAQHKALDTLRRRASFDSKREELQKIAQLQQELSEASGTSTEMPSQRTL